MVQHHNFYAASPFSTPLHACMVHSRAMAWCAQAKVKSKVWLPLHQNHDEAKHHPTLMKPSNYTSYPIMPMTMKPLTHNIYIYIYTYTHRVGLDIFMMPIMSNAAIAKDLIWVLSYLYMHKWVVSHLPFQVYIYSTLDNYFIVYLEWVINIVKHENYTKQYCILLCK